MDQIKILDQKTANKIAAGEVIINPASVIKELLENSIDANASSIIVKIRNGGKEYISVKDNGVGMSSQDALAAFKRHATSKIRTIDDLETTNTLGFRGEALASIASVSKIKMLTRRRKSQVGIEVQIQGGNLIESKEIGCSPGTYLNVEDLFYNTPARYKHLKKDSLEAGYVSAIIERIALSHPEISIKFIHGDRQVFHTPGNGDLYSCVYSLFGKDFANNLIKMDYMNQPLKIKGFIGKPQLTRSNRNHQIFFVNQRYVKNKILHKALEEAYKGLVMIHKLPVCVLNIHLPQEMLDVNVHPAKTEILFRNESLIYLLLKQAIIDCLKNQNLIPEIPLSLSKYKEVEGANGGDKVQEQVPIEITKTSLKSRMGGNPNPFLKVEGKEFAKKRVEKNNHEEWRVSRDTLAVKNDVQEPLKKDYDALVDLEQGRVVGQIFSTYIIIETVNELYLIDQHAAHERIIYDRFKKEYENSTVLSQNLMPPVHMDVSYSDMQLILDNKPLLNRIGFEIEEFGANSLLIRSVPLIYGQPLNASFALEIIEYLGRIKDINIQEQENKLITMACKAAIKANDSLKVEEISQLIHDLRHSQHPYTCPHGRPIIVKLTKYELEKMFKRVQ